MIVFPNAKINLGLRILQKRSDGYHNLETVFYPLPFYDALEIIRSAEGTVPSFSSTGISIDIPTNDNLCVRAYSLLKKDFPQIPPISIHLHKSIPAGAGLGGGSADASFMLVLLNQFFGLGINNERLQQYSLQLGSDCPFFIINKPCFATGRGEQLEPLAITLSGFDLAIVNPGISINTGEAFSMLRPMPAGRAIKEIISQPVSSWKDELVNDFEQPVFQQYPAIKHIRESLYQGGAIYASLSGSGSTVYGIFERGQRPELEGYKVRWFYNL